MLMVQKLLEIVGRHVNIVAIQNTSIHKSVNANASHDIVPPDLHKTLTLASVLAREHVQMAIL